MGMTCRLFGHAPDPRFKDYRGVRFCERCRRTYVPGWGPFMVWLYTLVVVGIVSLTITHVSRAHDEINVRVSDEPEVVTLFLKVTKPEGTVKHYSASIFPTCTECEYWIYLEASNKGNDTPMKVVQRSPECEADFDGNGQVLGGDLSVCMEKVMSQIGKECVPWSEK